MDPSLRFNYHLVTNLDSPQNDTLRILTTHRASLSLPYLRAWSPQSDFIQTLLLYNCVTLGKRLNSLCLNSVICKMKIINCTSLGCEARMS